MKALITGGAGFVGSHLTERLLEKGDEVHVIDDLSTGSIENIEPFKGRPGFHYTIETILNEPVLAELVDRVDVVFHLAAAVGTPSVSIHGRGAVEEWKPPGEIHVALRSEDSIPAHVSPIDVAQAAAKLVAASGSGITIKEISPSGSSG